MRGDYSELQVARERVPDGQGGEIDGLTIRVWGEAETFDEDRDQRLIVELRVPLHSPPVDMPSVRDLIKEVLECMEEV